MQMKRDRRTHKITLKSWGAWQKLWCKGLIPMHFISCSVWPTELGVHGRCLFSRFAARRRSITSGMSLPHMLDSTSASGLVSDSALGSASAFGVGLDVRLSVGPCVGSHGREHIWDEGVGEHADNGDLRDDQDYDGFRGAITESTRAVAALVQCR